MPAFIIRTISFIVAGLFTCFSLYAQPGPEEAVGCHITHQRIAGISYTPEELAYAKAALERSDTFDVLEYRIHLTVKDFQLSQLVGYTEVDFKPKMDGLNYLNLDLERLVVDSVLYRGNPLPFTHVGPLLTLQFPDVLTTQDTHSVVVYYKGVPMTSASGFGGFYFENGYAYNLGIGIRDKPHNYGRAWFPCFDNFVERSTYEYHITHASNHMAYCVGTYLGTEDLGNGLMRTSYRMEQPIPTYLSSVAVSDYSHIEFNHPGENGIIPVRLIARPADLNAFENSFQQIGKQSMPLRNGMVPIRLSGWAM
jgi:aminopeptidase N